jgi:hypothetical protein
MRYTTKKGESYDLEKGFSGPERHILHKLLLWKEMTLHVEEFRRKKQEALVKGWGDSGPAQESGALQSLLQDFETCRAAHAGSNGRKDGTGLSIVRQQTSQDH